MSFLSRKIIYLISLAVAGFLGSRAERQETGLEPTEVVSNTTTVLPVIRNSTNTSKADSPCEGKLLPYESECVLYCDYNYTSNRGFRRLECSKTSVDHVHSVFGILRKTLSELTANLFPLHVRLSQISGDLSSETFKTLPEPVQKLELVGVNIANFTNGSLVALGNVVHLDLNGVLNEVIPSGAFEGMGRLEILQIRNMPNLKTLEKGSLDALLGRDIPPQSGQNPYQPTCLDIDISNKNFACDCDSAAWMTKTVLRRANRESEAVSQAVVTENFPEGPATQVRCKVNIVCSGNSVPIYREQTLTATSNLTCSSLVPSNTTEAPTTSRPTVTARVTTQKHSDGASVSGHLNLICVFALVVSMLQNLMC